MSGNMIRNIIFYTTVLLIFNACSTPTGYVKRDGFWGSGYGFSDKKIEDNEFAIIAKGNGYSTCERVAKLALYHAAHVTIKNGKNYFEILQKSEKALPNHELILIPIPIPIPNGFMNISVPVGEESTNEVTAILIIRLAEQAQPSSSIYINAEQVINELKPIFGKK